MYKPHSTYRIQFHKGFNFNDFERIIPYLKTLGIDTIYASPIFEATPGSTHGYDTVNPLRIHPEIGTEAQLLNISKALQKLGIGWLQDVVPNHMAFHPANAWLMDVLKRGQQSAYAHFFDIDFESGDGKLMVPFLGETLPEAVKNGTVTLISKGGEFFLHAGEDSWPVNDASRQQLIQVADDGLAHDQQLILEIANAQYYRLCSWTETVTTINYRRFFTVNSLICTNIQYEKVFDAYHQYILSLVKKGVFQGLRIDHVDGLYDPKAYLEKLRAAVGEKVYLVVEKILEYGEDLPVDWPIQGTTGYDFLSFTNNLFTNTKAEKPFTKIYQKVTGKHLKPEKLMREKKQHILAAHMGGELNRLCRLFIGLDVKTAVDEADIKDALSAFLIAMPVYRFYHYQFPLPSAEQHELELVIQSILNKKKTRKAGELLRWALIDKPLQADASYLDRLSAFYQRCMQFTGPLMAKGIEDTLMFTHNRFVGHNEVGDASDAFGLGIDAFHGHMQQRQQVWPFSLNGSSTHDTKRGEDVRARLNVLSDIPKDWGKFVGKLWHSVEAIGKDYPELKVVHPNDAYLLIQTIVGVIPFSDADEDDFLPRLEQFLQKALREAKKRSGWAEPDESYEQAVFTLGKLLLSEKYPSHRQIRKFVDRITEFAISNSLSQLILKFTCPGIPDIYQGTELWDLSMVDPDNRREVDYQQREAWLNRSAEQTLSNLWNEGRSGRIKLQLMQGLLTVRNRFAHIFEEGDYIPLTITGKHAGHVMAFARALEGQWLLVAVPLGLAKLCHQQNTTTTDIDWSDTTIILPEGAGLGWKDLLSEHKVHKDLLDKGLRVADLFDYVPFAALEMKAKPHTRNAGLLMHISSLPSPYAIGDMGAGAREFVDFLHQAGYHYWQILPLNPVSEGNAFSPYSSSSASAGNVLLISLELLQEAGLVDDADLATCKAGADEHVDFVQARDEKLRLLHQGWRRFKSSTFPELESAFQVFKKRESSWLEEYALHHSLQIHLKNEHWYEWPDDYKFRKQKTLTLFQKQYAAEMEELKWQQFIFYQQWESLRSYAHERRVSFIGDLPFYLDYGAHEVWANPSLFQLNAKLERVAVAGVPPDYFNEDGQLWGMPVFNWAEMQNDGYQWWFNRIINNLKHFDLLRLDHFRAFAEYWSAPAGAQTAAKGEWQDGPGADFFNLLFKKHDASGLIAEDLGAESEGVDRLLREFPLPGMRVLQFGFGADLAATPHHPQNFDTRNIIAYTGTHDNNTIRGWWNTEADEPIRKHVKQYFKQSVGDKNIHRLMMHLLHSSVAKTTILPIQDLLGLDEQSRMNVPGKAKGNWSWRLAPKYLTRKLAKKIRKDLEMYGRL